jgi:hypothetical protein
LDWAVLAAALLPAAALALRAWLIARKESAVPMPIKRRRELGDGWRLY